MSQHEADTLPSSSGTVDDIQTCCQAQVFGAGQAGRAGRGSGVFGCSSAARVLWRSETGLAYDVSCATKTPTGGLSWETPCRISCKAPVTPALLLRLASLRVGHQGGHAWTWRATAPSIHSPPA